jgi:glyoxylase-like metal-dependent hydrolase (beta-lactamase superfamily II)
MISNSSPELHIPKSDECCKVSIINTTCDLTVPPDFLVEPPMNGYEWMNMPTFSFYIEHQTSKRQLLFDLGARKDWENHVPHIKALVSGHVPGIRISENVLDIVAKGGVKLDELEALILSHWHFDHCGAPSQLPKDTRVVVGPRFKESFLPGYPAREDSPFHEADFKDREVVEISFDTGLKIGQYQAYDYFADGSLFILNVPGHAIGHISALVRTTPDTFVFLGGDVCHHTGDIRPSSYIPLPSVIPDTVALDRRIPRPCPCSAFLSSHHLGDQGHNVRTGGPRHAHAVED